MKKFLFIFTFLLFTGCSMVPMRNMVGEKLTPNLTLNVNDVLAVVIDAPIKGDNGEAFLTLAIEGKRYRLNCNRSYAFTCESAILGQTILLKDPQFVSTVEQVSLTASNIELR